MSILTVSDQAQFKPYGSGRMYCHVLAFQVSTSVNLVDLLVTDYTSNPAIVCDRIRLPQFEGLDVAPQQVLHLSIPLKLLISLADEYQARFGEEFFDRMDAHLTQTNWVPLHDKFCLADLTVGVQKKSTHLTGHVVLVRLLSDVPDVMPFFNRFLEKCGLLLAANPARATKVIQNLGWQAYERVSSELGPLAADSTSYSSESQTQVKAEQTFEEQSLEELDLQEQLRELLEPVSQPAQHQGRLQSQIQPQSQSQNESQSQYLTQLHSVQPDDHQSPPEESQDYMVHADSERSTLFVPESWSPPQYCLLARLNELPLVPDNTVYTTEAYVAGSIPPNLECLCTKVYEAYGNSIELSDPQVAPLELILLDSLDSQLTPDNSIMVSVESKDILKFVGVEFAEQLYTRLGHFQRQFRRRPLRKVTVELSIVTHDGISGWAMRNLDFQEILGEKA